MSCGHCPHTTRVDNKTISLNLLEHVDHVVQVNEGIVDGDNVGSLLQSGPEDQATDTAKSVDSDGSHV